MKKPKTTRDLHDQRAVLWNESIGAHKKYIDPATGMFAKKYLAHRDCPACRSKKSRRLFSKEGGTYVKCDKCAMVFLNPVLKDDVLSDFYRNNHTVQAQIVESDMSFYSNLYNKGLDVIESALRAKRANPHVLDIGCSSGVFLDVAKQRGWSTTGLELNLQEAELAKAKGHRVLTELLQQAPLKADFNAITMWDVFEHIKDGASYLKMMKRLLKPGGIIFMQIPSSASLAARVLQEKCNMFDGMEHVNLYGLNAIKALARRCDMGIKAVTTVIAEIGVLNNYLEYDNPYSGGTLNRESVLGILDDNVINRALLGYKYQLALGESKKRSPK